MELGIKERLVIAQILPVRGTYADMKILVDLKNDLGLSEAEHKEFNIRIEDGKVKWDKAKEVKKEVSLGNRASGIIREQLESLNKKKLIDGDMIPIYEKFVND